MDRGDTGMTLGTLAFIQRGNSRAFSPGERLEWEFPGRRALCTPEPLGGGSWEARNPKYWTRIGTMNPVGTRCRASTGFSERPRRSAALPGLRKAGKDGDEPSPPQKGGSGEGGVVLRDVVLLNCMALSIAASSNRGLSVEDRPRMIIGSRQASIRAASLTDSRSDRSSWYWWPGDR
jgi:hypothetical protein